MSKIIATTADGRTRDFWSHQYAAACDWLNTEQPQFADKGFTRFGAVLRHVSEVEASQQDTERRKRRLRDEERRMYLMRQEQSVSFLICKPEHAQHWEIPRGTKVPTGWELEACQFRRKREPVFRFGMSQLVGCWPERNSVAMG